MASDFRIRNSIFIQAPIIVSAILIAVQFLTLERLKFILLKDTFVRASRLEFGDKIKAIMDILSPVDWLLIFSLLGLIVWVIFMEMRYRRLSKELEHIFASDKASLFLLGAMAFMISRFYLAPGHFALGDSASHLSRVWASAESLSRGHWPSWSFFNYGGFPLLQFYGPLFFVLTGSIAALFGSIDWTTKAVLFCFHFGSAFPVYGWARAIGSTRQAALICAIAYIISFQHTHAVIWTGALPVAMIYVLFPLLFLAIERSLSFPGRGRMILLAGTVAALILCHHGYAAAGLQLAVLYLGIRSILPGTARPKFAHAIRTFLGILGGVLLCSGFLWPILMEAGWVSQPTGIPLLKPGIPNLEFFKKILLWRNLWSGWTLAYMGITLAVFAAVGGFLSCRRAHRTREADIQRAILLLAIIAFFCTASFGRNANLALLFVALLSGGITRLHIGSMPKRLVLIVLAALLLDLGPTTIQSPYRTDRRFLHEGLRRAAGLIGPHRALVGYASEAGTHYFHWGSYEDTRLILPTGYFPQGAPRSLNSINAMVDAINTPEDTVQSYVNDLLYLWDVAGLILHSRDRFVQPRWQGSRAGDSDPPIGWIRPASPLLFSEQAVIAADETLEKLQTRKLLLLEDQEDAMRRAYLRRMLRWVERMHIDMDANHADTIFVTDMGTGSEALRNNPTGMHDSPPGMAIRTMDYRVEMNYVSIKYRASKAGYIRLAFSWYPTLRVLVDGAPVTPMRSLMGAVVIPADKGEHTIELIPTQSSRRRFSLIIGAVIGTAVVLTAMKRNSLSGGSAGH